MLVRVHDFLNKNRKLATKFEGPFRIIELNQHYAVLKSAKGKPFKRNILHLKPYFPPDSTTPLPSWAALEQGAELLLAHVGSRVHEQTATRGGAEADEPDIANIDQVNQQTDGDDSSELEDICSFF